MKKIIISNKWNQYRRRKRWWSILFDFILLALIVVMLVPSTRKALSVFVIRNTMLSPRESSTTIFLNDEDWDFTFTDSLGNKIKLSSFSDKPVLVNFWATWCPPCVAELPALQRLYDKYKNDVYFVFISNEPVGTVNRFMSKHEYSIPYYFGDGDNSIIFEASVIPATYLIHNGHLIISKRGAARWNSRKFFKLMDNLIDED